MPEIGNATAQKRRFVIQVSAFCTETGDLRTSFLCTWRLAEKTHSHHLFAAQFAPHQLHPSRATQHPPQIHISHQIRRFVASDSRDQRNPASQPPNSQTTKTPCSTIEMPKKTIHIKNVNKK
jgi:hypothetical protein